MAHLILIIESDHDTRVKLRNYFEKSKYIVVSATNGADALTLLPNITQPSLIVLSKKLPLMDGESFLSVFRQNANYLSIPVCQLLHNDNESLMEGATCSASFHHLESDLHQCVQSCLEKTE